MPDYVPALPNFIGRDRIPAQARLIHAARPVQPKTAAATRGRRRPGEALHDGLSALLRPGKVRV